MSQFNDEFLRDKAAKKWLQNADRYLEIGAAAS